MTLPRCPLTCVLICLALTFGVQSDSSVSYGVPGVGVGVVQQQRDTYTDAAALSTIGVLTGGEHHGEHSFSQDSIPQGHSESYGVPSQIQTSYGGGGHDSGGWGMPEMKGWGMPETTTKGWGWPPPPTKGWGKPETTTKGWGRPKSKSKSKAPKSSGGWGKPKPEPMKGWGMPEMKGWGPPEMKGWGMETTTKGWESEGPSYKYKYKVIPHEEEEEEGWGWPEEEEKGKKKGLYGLFGLFGLMGILPWIFIIGGGLILAVLLFVPIPVIQPPAAAGGRQHLESMFSLASSKLFNSTMDLESMQTILKAISKDYTSVYKNTECIERWACTLTQWARKRNNNTTDSTITSFTKLIGASDNNFVKRVKQGIVGADKKCENFKCDLISKTTLKNKTTKTS